MRRRPWRSRRSPTSRPTPRRRASTTPTSSRTRSRGSCPGRRGDHDIKVGVQYEYIEADNFAQDNLNGTFAFGQNDLPFDADDPRTYPDRLTIRVPRPERVSTRRRTTSRVRAGQVEVATALTVTPRPAVRRRGDPASRSSTTRASSSRTTIRSTETTSSRASASRMRSTAAAARCPRRLRPVLRQDALRGHRRYLQRRRLLQLVHGELPDLGGRSRPAQRPVPDRPVPGQRTGRQPGAARQRFPAGERLRNTGNVTLGQSRSRSSRDRTSCRSASSASSAAALSASADYVHVWGRAVFMTQDLNKGSRADDAHSTDPIVRPESELRPAVNTSDQRPARPSTTRCCCRCEQRFSQQLQRRASRTRCRMRAATRAAQRRRRGQLPGRAGSEPGSERRADRLRSPSQLRRSAAARSCRTPTA